MNTKKFLDKQAEQDRKQILDSDNGEFLQALEQKLQPQPKAKKRLPRFRVWFPALASAAAAIVLIVCLAVFYPFGGKSVEYFDQNIRYSESTVEELNRDMKQFNLQIDTAVYSVDIIKATDSVSGDILYYTTDISSADSFVQMQIVTVCNPNYKLKTFSFNNTTTTAKLPNYSVIYETSTVPDTQFGLDFLQAKAKIQKGKEFVYVTSYSELLLEPESEGTFLETLQSIVK
ncbi:MAG: hypothetical protein K2H43_01075 [Clostridia bacterium]|nr:hypothetical protein [Clostridia bacterium]